MYFYFHFADYIYRVFTRQKQPNAFAETTNHAKNSIDRTRRRITQTRIATPQKRRPSRNHRSHRRSRSHGDLSENAEYEAAKEKQGFIEGRISELEHKLSMAHIINPAEIHAEGKIVFGTTVTLEDLETEEHVTYQIVGEDEADIKEGKIYVGSPIARALIGKEEGDVAEVQAPGGVREYDIISVQYI